ncbi:hypothetical protein D9613_005936 [Agrocybe pediades]|uniref:DNA repair protein RAD50 n=1 Tax=Agrocybe pediades TaxID=84607 RepID=A0A8H4VP50_9AGAR|nr:hypothetical protein D9613_005936 [Agrocybe pediades]
MAHLNKLAIRGIRSFDDKQISVIEFFSPVTVIVGHNGSGKTTIIECLKYATTGDQPANTRGGAFIHDPKMANEKEVKAQVKLRFHAANGTRMLAVRNLSVTAKKTTGLTMKTLESILAVADGNTEKGGKRGVISTKCAEMDIEIPQLLGVSKAVLENVIFCHQEDSYWPLAEPGALKKKFDDIFEATRYTKALDSIKALRKDRMAELKAEKERLMSLLREKAHADKLKDRIAEMKSLIDSKEVEYEESKQKYDALVESNRKFYESYSKFREMYLTVKKLEESKAKTAAHMDEVKANCRPIPGTLEELENQASDFENSIKQLEGKRASQKSHKDDLEEELNNLQLHQKQLLALEGRLAGEAEEQKRRIASREQAIHETSETYGIKGFTHSPLERENVTDFFARLTDVQRSHQHKYESLQSELKTRNDDYHNKMHDLNNQVASLKSQKTRIADQISERQQSIKEIEMQLEKQDDVSTRLHTCQSDIEELNEILKKKEETFASANFKARLEEMSDRSRLIEAQREKLSEELSSLTKDVSTRAKLEVRKGEIKTKLSDMDKILESSDKKYRSIAAGSLSADTIEKLVEKLHADKDIEQKKFAGESRLLTSKVEKAEEELRRLEKLLKDKHKKAQDLRDEITSALQCNFEGWTLEDAIAGALTELNIRQSDAGTSAGAKKVYQSLLNKGKQEKICGACNRAMTDGQLAVFEQQMKTYIAEAMKPSDGDESPEDQVKSWTEEADMLQKLRPSQALLDEITEKDIPLLEKQIAELKETLPSLQTAAKEVDKQLENVTEHIKEIAWLKNNASTFIRLKIEVEKATQEAKSFENELTAGGSSRTLDVVQNELTTVNDNLKKSEKDARILTNEMERQATSRQETEKKLLRLQLEERDLQTMVNEKERLEEDVKRMKKEIATYAPQSKEIDVKISEAYAPITALKVAHQQVEEELSTRIAETQGFLEDLNRILGRLTDMNKTIDRYVREKKAGALEDCSSRLAECEAQLLDLQSQIETSREVINSIEKEINESEATFSNLRNNIIVQKLTRDIASTQAEIDSYDMEEAAKARRNYEDKYEPAKKKEDKLGEVYHQLTGEIGSLKAQLKSLETDAKEYKNVYKNYTDQLIRVKVSDMANNDLEKYAKALDNAIMKYHGLKMEEVNDTMKHLWNKTYQGTDIDGIKIRSDVEGGASKRSYNYRVVMTKDQVEMDMRGRCSAGQKMLASIIIRLALSDSFGQNCGILALDEPTNALDTENIDALASSLVDIINERKAHSNFQLIIITHDENFLTKLGQSDVMDYYWFG